MTHIIRTLAAMLAAAAMTAVAMLAPSADAHPRIPSGVQVDARPVLHTGVEHMVLTPCAEEDTRNCYWNARRQGNGHGHSHYNVRVGHLTCVVYWDRAYNRRHGYCA